MKTHRFSEQTPPPLFLTFFIASFNFFNFHERSDEKSTELLRSTFTRGSDAMPSTFCVLGRSSVFYFCRTPNDRLGWCMEFHIVAQLVVLFCNLHRPNDAATDVASYLAFCIVPLLGRSICTEKVPSSVHVNKLEGISIRAVSTTRERNYPKSAISITKRIRIFDILCLKLIHHVHYI